MKHEIYKTSYDIFLKQKTISTYTVLLFKIVGIVWYKTTFNLYGFIHRLDCMKISSLDTFNLYGSLFKIIGMVWFLDLYKNHPFLLLLLFFNLPKRNRLQPVCRMNFLEYLCTFFSFHKKIFDHWYYFTLFLAHTHKKNKTTLNRR